MKKKYFAPEFEEIEIEAPVLLAESESEGGESGICMTDNSCPDEEAL
jgi:hypothetical protein